MAVKKTNKNLILLTIFIILVTILAPKFINLTGKPTAQEMLHNLTILVENEDTECLLKGVTVDLYQTSKIETKLTNSNDFKATFSGLEEDEYYVIVTASGYKTWYGENCKINLDEDKTFKITLEPGSGITPCTALPPQDASCIPLYNKYTTYFFDTKTSIDKCDEVNYYYYQETIGYVYANEQILTVPLHWSVRGGNNDNHDNWVYTADPNTMSTAYSYQGVLGYVFPESAPYPYIPSSNQPTGTVPLSTAYWTARGQDHWIGNLPVPTGYTNTGIIGYVFPDLASCEASLTGTGTPECTDDADCDDSDYCTTDTCSSGTCSNVDITTCETTADGCCPDNCNDITGDSDYDIDCVAIACISNPDCNIGEVCDNITSTSPTYQECIPCATVAHCDHASCDGLQIPTTPVKYCEAGTAHTVKAVGTACTEDYQCVDNICGVLTPRKCLDYCVLLNTLCNLMDPANALCTPPTGC